MIKSEWGTKHTCGQCGAPFYDMRRRPAECPKCGAVVSEKKTQKPRRSVAPPEIKPKATAASEAKKDVIIKKPDTNDDAANKDGDEILEPVEGGEEDDGVIEDASDIGESDDDLSEVLEHVDEAVADNT